MSPFLAAFALTVLAGLATGLGGLVVLASRRPSPRALAAGLGLSAGVMVYVSFVELLPVGTDSIAERHPEGAYLLASGAFFAGIALMALLGRLVPDDGVPPALLVGGASRDRRSAHLMRTGLLTAIAITLHNLPEGFATLISALDDPKTGAGIAVAVALHNVPEGIAVAVPIHEATGSRVRAIAYAVGSGLAEPVGAILLYLTLRPFISPTLMGVCLAGVAGVMVFVSLDELLPTAGQHGEHRATTYGLVAGMAVMALSLEVLRAGA